MTEEHDAKHLEAWRQGGLNPIILSPFEWSAAIALRSKLYRLRKKLEREKHPVFEQAKLATIKLYPTTTKEGKTIFNLMIAPTNMEFDQAFANAGIKADEPPPLD